MRGKDRDARNTWTRFRGAGHISDAPYGCSERFWDRSYTPPRPLEEIESDIKTIERDILRMLAEVTG
jgi:hypothetical protein